MKVLIGCEESQEVCKAFRKLGIETFSNDIKDCSGDHPEWHLKMDVLEAIKLYEWDFIGLHPVCTKITLSGNRTYAPGKPKEKERIKAVEWTINLWLEACRNAKYVYLENPLGALNSNSRMPKPQIIHPYYFGDEYQKTTCLWMKNLPKLFHAKERDLFNDKITHVGKGEIITFKSGKKMAKWYSDAFRLESSERACLRSKTFPGIAKAMSEQWIKYINQNQ